MFISAALRELKCGASFTPTGVPQADESSQVWRRGQLSQLRCVRLICKNSFGRQLSQGRHRTADVCASGSAPNAWLKREQRPAKTIALALDYPPHRGDWKWSGRGRLGIASPPRRLRYSAGDAQCRMRAIAHVSSGIGARLASVTTNTSCFVCLSMFAFPRSPSHQRHNNYRS